MPRRDGASHPALARARPSTLAPRRGQGTENHAGEQELKFRRKRARAVPAAVVEELPSPWPQERKYVLEVGGAGRRGADGRRIERASTGSEEQEARDTAADLEPTRAKVFMRHSVA